MGSIKCAKNDTLASQFDYINSLPNVSFVKDINSAFQSLSVGCLRITGWKSLEQAIFNTAYDFPSDASILADRFRDIDNKSMSKNGKILSLELINTDMGLASLLVERTPIMGQKGDVLGVHAQAIDIANTSFFQYSQMLSKVDQKIISSNNQSAVYILNSEHSPLPLNIQEQECLFFLVRGKTIGQIAEILNLTT